MKKRLIALMVGATITATTLVGCGQTRHYGDVPIDDLDLAISELVEEERQQQEAREEAERKEQTRHYEEVRHLLEEDIGLGLLLDNAGKQTIDVEYLVENQRYYISFCAKKWIITSAEGSYKKWAEVTYEVSEDFYSNFRSKYNETPVAGNVELVRSLVEKYEPCDLVYPVGIETVEK